MEDKKEKKNAAGYIPSTVWHNTDVEQAVEMLEVSDEFTHSVSSGEVTKVNYSDPEEGEEQDLTGTLDDEKIFGALSPAAYAKETRSTAMGHIELAVPVVNIQYTRGRKPILAGLLGMSMQEMEQVAYFAKYVVTDKGNSGFKDFQTITEKEYLDAVKNKEQFTAKIGAEAIAELLEKKNIPGREFMVLNTIPVLPFPLRYRYHRGTDAKNDPERYIPKDIQSLYHRVVNRTQRIKKLAEIKCPDIILRCESRMLQEAVDSLVSNGARGLPVTDPFGTALSSLQETYERIHGQNSLRKEKVTPNNHIDMVQLMDTLGKISKICSENNIENPVYDYEDIALEVQNAINKEEQDLLLVLRPYFDEYLQDNYSRYVEFAEEIFEYITANHLKYLYNYAGRKDLEEIIRNNVEYGIMYNTDLYIKKQVKWTVIAQEEKD